MNHAPILKLELALASVLALIVATTRADTFGSGTNTFTIDFVDVGNAGNADDAGAGGGVHSSPFGGVAYAFRMGTYEVSQDAITNATASGLMNVTAGVYSGNLPATNVTWYEAAAFVNWLNTSTGNQPAYNLNSNATALTLWTAAEAWDNDPGAGVELNLFRHKDARYFLPSEDEWYKAAFHQNDGATANYWDYATASNALPLPVAGGTAAGTVVYQNGGGITGPAAVNNAGGLSAYGTMGQDGNVVERLESAFVGANDIASENRAVRAGFWNSASTFLTSANRDSINPIGQNPNEGFRVASVVPEPTSAMLLLGTGGMWLLASRRRSVR